MPLSSRVEMIDSIMKPAVKMIDEGLKLFSGQNVFGLTDSCRLRPNRIPYGTFFHHSAKVVESSNDNSLTLKV